MGLPVISTLHSGIPELVRDGASGFLVPEHDENAIYDRLKYLVDHPGLWPDIGSNGRKTVEANHDIVKLNDSLSEIFLKSLG
jgi:colanic acid/amylovoran biosynthesis glycosyltransferase